MAINTPQLRHYGMDIPVDIQPKCPSCGGYCQLTHMMEDWFWICLEASRGLECDAPEIPLEATPEAYRIWQAIGSA